ncbi:nucleotide-binding protein [Leucobacter sp. HY1910]
MGQQETIGLLGPADIARLLHSAGFKILGGQSFADAAKQIRAAQADLPPFPIIVVDDGSAGLKTWLESQARRTDVRVICSVGGPLIGHDLAVDLPVTLGDLITGLGLELPEGADPTAPIGAGGLTHDRAEALPSAAPVSPESALAAPAKIEYAFDMSEPAPAPSTPLAAAAVPPVAQPPAQEPIAPVVPPAARQPVSEAVIAPPITPTPVVPEIPLTPTAEAAAAPTPRQTLHDRHSVAFQHAERTTRTCEVIIPWAGKGGVGKTSFTLAIAQKAGSIGLRVLVVDGNRGQASTRHLLRLAEHGLPTITDTRHMLPDQVVTDRAQLAAIRGSVRGEANFDIVLGPIPEGDDANPVNTPAALYARAIAELRSSYDLIVVDTQIAESHFSDMWTDVMIPLMRGGAWGVGIFDDSPSGLDELDGILDHLIAYGVPNTKQLVVANKWPDFPAEDEAFVAQRFAGRARFVGVSEPDFEFHDSMTAGMIPTDPVAVGPVVHAILQQAIGGELFPPIEREAKTKRRGFFRKRGK